MLVHQLARAKENGVSATLTPKQWTTAIEYFGYRCAYCQKRPFSTMDHFIPVHMGGGTTADNCLPTCRTCNTSKHRKDPDHWLQHRCDPEQAVAVRAYLAQMR
jgi:5-methylcytosine-specific restriction endonuclease McrA